MTSPDRVRDTVERYLDAHAGAQTSKVIGLFSPGATLEDPVGSEPHVGFDSVRVFFTRVHERNGTLHLEPVSPIIVAGAEATVHVRAWGVDAEPATAVDVIYIFTVDPQQRISRLRAFFDLDAG